jgi:hypothetical protein
MLDICANSPSIQIVRLATSTSQQSNHAFSNAIRTPAPLSNCFHPPQGALSKSKQKAPELSHNASEEIKDIMKGQEENAKIIFFHLKKGIGASMLAIEKRIDYERKG